MGQDILFGQRNQDAYPAIRSDGGVVGVRVNNRGEIVTPDWLTQLAIDGRMFSVSNSAQETATAMGGTSYSGTAPALIVDAPSGTTIIPVRIALHQGGTVAGGDITCIFSGDSVARYSSSGTALTIRSHRRDAPVTSSAVAYVNPTTAANTLDWTFFTRVVAADVDPTAEVDMAGQNVVWTAGADGPPFILVGAASLVLYTFAGTTQPSWFYSVTWVEIPTVSVT